MVKIANRCRGGFTLMEIALVLAILVAIAAMAAPAYQGTLKRERVRKAAESIAADWTKTRALAIETGETQLWVCTIAEGTYSASAYLASGGGGLTNAAVAGMVAPLGNAMGAAATNPDGSFGQSMPDGVSITEVLVSEGDTVVTMGLATNSGESGAASLLFFPDGSSSSARIVVTGEDRTAMAAVINGTAGTVRVIPVESSQ